MLVLGGCGRQVAQQPARPSSPPKPALKQAPPTPIAVKKEELGQPSWDPQWDVIVEKALSPEMLYAESRPRRENVLPTIRQHG